MKEKVIKKIIGAVAIITVLMSSISAMGITVENDRQQGIEKSNVSRPYDGYLRVYVVEPESRWDNYDGDPYHFGFLDFAINEQLSIDYLDTYTKQVTWNAQQAGYSNVEEANIMVMAAVFNPQDYQRYAYPPSSNPFDAYFVDAAAVAIPGETGYNFKNESFTHTVFCEEGTATWCVYCPAAAENLKTVYDTYDYPFYFVAMIADKVTKAQNRLNNDYNLYGYPTSFFDGGYKAVVGSSSASTFRNRVISSGARDVHELDLSLSLVWAGSGVLDIEVIITNNEEMPNVAPTIPEIDGQNKGKPGEELEFTVVSTDIDGDEIFYCVDWGDDTGEVCIGPFPSGDEVPISHIWTEEGSFIMKVKARDTLDHESDYAEFEITLEKSKVVNMVLHRFLQRLSNTFPILGQLLGL